ncbi:MAG TPA: rhodanese-like domain-containing protein [Tepidisphaeraceae bacterium]|jgi:rhodanese-related sulfurtransferase|nr:rhodanese-like domain-containing protein [Tepidisphaeraceae bacterium]
MAKSHSPRFLKLAEEAKQSVREVSPTEVKRMLDTGDRFHLIDVREDHEWAVGHLPQARHLGRGILERDIEKAVPDERDPIVLYCGGGYRSAMAAMNLARMGYTNVLSMQGGFSGWEEAGLDVSR